MNRLLHIELGFFAVYFVAAKCSDGATASMAVHRASQRRHQLSARQRLHLLTDQAGDFGECDADLQMICQHYESIESTDLLSFLNQFGDTDMSSHPGVVSPEEAYHWALKQHCIH